MKITMTCVWLSSQNVKNHFKNSKYLYLIKTSGGKKELQYISRAECDTILNAYTMYRHLE